MKMNLDQIKIVLIGTSHPGNIGAAARAMKTMGLSQLVLVAPERYPHQQAIEMASGAIDILEQAEVVDNLESAIGDCHLVIGSSARPRDIQLPLYPLDELSIKLSQEQSNSKIAILFGRERTGLTNEELMSCHYHVMIDANPEYSSLNLAQAVQLFSYEVRKSASRLESNLSAAGSNEPIAQAEEVSGFFNHLQQVLIQTEFLDPANPKKVMPKLKRLFNRARLLNSEINILRGILTSIQNIKK